MAFGDFDHFTFALAGTSTAALDVTTPIVGSGSLRYLNDTATDNFSMNSNLDSGFNRGFTKGRIRTLVRFDGGWVDSGTSLDNMGVGIYYMSDNFDISNTTSDFYFAGLVRDRNIAGSVKPVIAKTSAARILSDLDWEVTISPGPDILYGTASSIAGVADTDVIPIQIEWDLNISDLGGMRHTMSVGNIGDTVFTNLAVVYDVVESTNPFTVTVAEGIRFMAKSVSGPAANATATFDQTGTFRLV